MVAGDVPQPALAISEALQALEQRLLGGTLPGVQALRPLTREEAQIAARKLVPEARGLNEIDEAMRRRGLVQTPARARAYAPFSRTRGRPKVVTIIPYTPTDPKANIVGGVGMSEGEPANGVIATLQGTKVTKFTTLDFLEGKFSEREISVADLQAQPLERLVEERKRGSLEPDLTIDHAGGAAVDAFRVLLVDEASTAVHSAADIRGLIHNTPVVNQIAELQFLRAKGLSASPDVSCCSCCCCCWGSCSSCSAVSTHYLNSTYYASRGR